MAARALSARPAAATAALGAALVLCAGLLDAEPLYVPGIAFGLLALVAVAWVAAATRGARVHRRVGVARAIEDEPVAVEVVVGASRLLPGGAVLDDLLDGPAPLGRSADEQRVSTRVRFSRRGRKALGVPQLVIRDPFGLAGWTLDGTTDEDELLVLPRLEPVEAPDGGGSGSAVGRRPGRAAMAAEVELDGLRQHRPGSPASRIHWSAYARTGELLERRMRADGDTRPLVVLDPRGAAGEDDLDAAVRAAGSLAHHLALRGGCALLLPGERRPIALEPTLASWPHAHVRLALVDGSRGPALGTALARPGQVLYVTARRGGRPPRALAQAPRGARVLVVPGTVLGRRASFAVAGCTGYELAAAAVPEVAV